MITYVTKIMNIHKLFVDFYSKSSKFFYRPSITHCLSGSPGKDSKTAYEQSTGTNWLAQEYGCNHLQNLFGELSAVHFNVACYHRHIYFCVPTNVRGSDRF